MSAESTKVYPWLTAYLNEPGAPEPFIREFRAIGWEIDRLKAALDKLHTALDATCTRCDQYLAEGEPRLCHESACSFADIRDSLDNNL
jgi:hypothetical protein